MPADVTDVNFQTAVVISQHSPWEIHFGGAQPQQNEYLFDSSPDSKGFGSAEDGDAT